MGFFENRSQKQGVTVMLHFGRTGSTVLANQLRNHPKIDWATEIFDPAQIRLNPDKFDSTSPYRTIENFITSKTRPFFGFELKVAKGMHLDQWFSGVDIGTLIGKLENLNVDSFVILKRKNYLRQYVSAHVAWQRNVWHIDKGSKSHAPTKIELPVNPATMADFKKPLVEYFEAKDAVYKEIILALDSKKALWLNYEEDLLTNPKVGYQKYLNFLGLKRFDSEIRLKKTTTQPLDQIIINYSEVKDSLKGTNYEWMLD